eukprot:GGOE01009825.1.p1 GENE.GGOE01009825.1~~GGOE01009825.1.p1  ORF type:complete len:492 (-),score=93.68 GGOE01009825.1:1574-3049(-)
MALCDLPKFYLDGTLVKCTTGPKPVCVALLNAEGGILLNSYVVPSGAVVDWCTKETSLSSFNDLLACNPVHLEQVQEYLHHILPPDSVLIGHGIEVISSAFGLQKGEHFTCLVEISDWFAVQLSRTLCQTFELAHILKMLLGDDVPNHESGKRDPLLDAQYARMLYDAYKDIPSDHPIMHQARQTLYEGLAKEKRLIDPALTMLLSCIPQGMTVQDIKKTIIPRQVAHLVDRLGDIQWTEQSEQPLSPVVGSTTLVFKSVNDVSQMVLRLHSNIDDWEWVVKKEGQCYIHKHNNMKIEEVEDIGLKVYVHSVPDDWSEADVKRNLVPEVLIPHVLEVKCMQFRRTKDKQKMLGRTHIMFNSEWCVMEMMRLLQVMNEAWGWTTQYDGSILFSHKLHRIMVEPAEPVTWEQLLVAYDEPTYEEKPVVMPPTWRVAEVFADQVDQDAADDEEMDMSDDEDITEDEISRESDEAQTVEEQDVAGEGSSAMMICV